jgi:hypothetical protein
MIWPERRLNGWVAMEGGEECSHQLGRFTFRFRWQAVLWGWIA